MLDDALGQGDGDGVKAESGAMERIEVYQTFWGNAWENKGEYRGGGRGPVRKAAAGIAEDSRGDVTATVEIRPEGVKEFYSVRQGCEFPLPCCLLCFGGGCWIP